MGPPILHHIQTHTGDPLFRKFDNSTDPLRSPFDHSSFDREGRSSRWVYCVSHHLCFLATDTLFVNLESAPVLVFERVLVLVAKPDWVISRVVIGLGAGKASKPDSMFK